MHNETMTHKKDPLSAETIQIMKAKLTLDYDFYYVARQTFNNLASSLGVTVNR